MTCEICGSPLLGNEIDDDCEVQFCGVCLEEIGGGGAFLSLDDGSTRPPVNTIDLHRGYAAEDHLWAERYRTP